MNGGNLLTSGDVPLSALVILIGEAWVITINSMKMESQPTAKRRVGIFTKNGGKTTPRKDGQ